MNSVLDNWVFFALLRLNQARDSFGLMSQILNKTLPKVASIAPLSTLQSSTLPFGYAHLLHWVKNRDGKDDSNVMNCSIWKLC